MQPTVTTLILSTSLIYGYVTSFNHKKSLPTEKRRSTAALKGIGILYF